MKLDDIGRNKMKLDDIVRNKMKLYGHYCTNYNGMYFTTEVDGKQVDLDYLPQYKEASTNAIDQICDILIKDCDEDGTYDGTDSYVTAVVAKSVNQFFGDKVEVEVVLDGGSS